MTAAEYQGTTLPANRHPELRIAWACDDAGYVTRVVLLGAAKDGDPHFTEVIRKYRQGSQLAPSEIEMHGWPTDETGRGLSVVEMNHLTLTEKAA